MALENEHEARLGVGRGLDDGPADGPAVLDVGVESLTIADAAARLGIAPDAVRKRIRRGSLRAVKVDGTWRVLFDPGEGTAGTQDTGVQAAAGPPETSVPAAVEDSEAVEAYRELVSSLRDQVDFLRRELESRSRELEGRAEEVRRRDVLLDAMAQRLRQLPPPADRPEDYRTVLQASVVPAEEMGRLKAELEQAQRRVAEFEAVTNELEREQEAAAAETARRPWWRFWG